jgi:hypothetical protein
MINLTTSEHADTSERPDLSELPDITEGVHEELEHLEEDYNQS